MQLVLCVYIYIRMHIYVNSLISLIYQSIF